MESKDSTKLLAYSAAIVIMIIVSIYFPIIRTETVTRTVTNTFRENNIHVFAHDSTAIVNGHQYKHIDTCQTCKLDKDFK